MKTRILAICCVAAFAFTSLGCGDNSTNSDPKPAAGGADPRLKPAGAGSNAAPADTATQPVRE